MRQLRLRRRPASPDEQAILDRQPPHDDGVALCLTAWAELSTCRPIGMAVGPIPWTAIIEWARFHGLDREATGVLVSVIRRLDNDRAEREHSKEH